MKSFWANPVFAGRYPLAVLAGLLWTAAFPKIGLAGFAWVAPGLMLAAAAGTTRWETFRLGYAAGLAHYLSLLYWLLNIPYRWHGVPLGPIAGWLALSAFVALFPAAWLWLVAPCAWRWPAPHIDPVAAPDSGPHSGWAGRTAWAFCGAAAWVALEFLLAWIFGGFPWALLGASQYELTPLIQIASATGVFGVSFLVVWVSLSLFFAVSRLVRRPRAGSVWVFEIALPVLAAAVVFSWGWHALRHESPLERSLRVTLVQPSIPQTLIWDPAGDDARFQRLLLLSRAALTNQPDLLVWPEAAVPKMLRYDTNTFAAISALAQTHHVWMMVGSDDAEPRAGAANREDADYFNSCFLISPEGGLVARYIKRNLVIFGEYVPLRSVLPFLKYFTPNEGGFTSGTHPVFFKLKDLQVQTSVLICFEDTFPQLARSDVTPQTDFLVNITNDGWFGHSAAQWQQATTALFRAVETGVPLLRCSNNGLTCWIDRCGRLRDLFRDRAGTVYGEGALTIEVPLRAAGEPLALTFYVRHGDWFAGACAGLTALMLMVRIRSRSRPKATNA